MLNPRAVKAFLNAPKDNWTWIKTASEEEIDEALSKLDPPPVFKVPLRLHQKACFLLGVYLQEFFFMLDMGTGKTSLTLELFRYFYDIGLADRFLVFVPTNELIDGWIDEANKWGVELPIVALRGSSQEKIRLVGEMGVGIAITTYQGLSMAMSDLTPKKKKPKENEMVMNPTRIAKFASRFGGIAFDQSTEAADTGSLYFKVCRSMARNMNIRFALAGRAFGNNPEMLWPQFYLVDKGKSLGPTVGLFREAFFTKSANYFSKSAYSFNYKFKKSDEERLSLFMANRSIRYSIDECMTLPERNWVQVKIQLPQEADAYYARAKDELLKAKGNLTLIDNVFLRMRQISSGFIGYKDDDTGEKAHVLFRMNPKLDRLIELVKELPLDAKIVIVHEFTHSGRMICRALEKEGFKHGWLYGGTKDWDGIKNSFNNDPDYRVLVINHKKGSMGLNLQVANYMAFFESPVGGIDRDEIERRIWRDGQGKKTFYYDLVSLGTVDERILYFHKQGTSIFKALVEDPSKALDFF